MFCPADAYVSLLLFVFIASLISASSVPVGKLSMIVTEKVNHEGVRLKSDNLIDKGPLNELSMESNFGSALIRTLNDGNVEIDFKGNGFFIILKDNHHTSIQPYEEDFEIKSLIHSSVDPSIQLQARKPKSNQTTR